VPGWPWTVADAITRIDRRLAVGFLGAEIGAPGLSARAVALRQLQTKRIGALKAARPGSPSSLELPLFVTAVTALDSFHVQGQGAVPWGTAAGSKVV
jgi:hypothetical protein